MKNKAKAALAGLVVLVLAAGLAGGGWKAGWWPLPGIAAQASNPTGKGGKDGKDKPAPPLEFAPQEVTQARMLRMPQTLSFTGTLVAPQTATVRARAGGTLVELSAVEGQVVRAGQVLGRVALAEINTQIAERGAQVAAAQAALAQAERTLANNQQLAAQQFISASAVDNSRAAVQTAQAQLQAAQASLQTTRVALQEAVVTAPISGVVSKRHTLPQERVAPEQMLLTIIDLSRLELAGQVGTHEVSRVRPGMAVKVQVEGLDTPVAGRVERLAPAAEPGTRSIGVTVALSNPQQTLRAGQYALAQITLPDDSDRLTLPVSAVGKTGGQDHVWLIENGLLARRAVTLGRRDEREGRVEVLQGLTAAQQVLAARFENLREGAKALVVARPQGSSPMASAAGSASSPLLK